MIQLSSLFQDHAVLQRGVPIPCWGWTEPDTVVVVTLGDSMARTLSNDRGAFFLRLPPMAAGGPHSLTVSIPSTGESLTITDLLVGEVWLGSGQSNMEFTVGACGSYADEMTADAEYSEIRLFRVLQRKNLGRQAECGGRWVPCSADTAREFSAVAFAFARRIHCALGVPVGMISSAWGGTVIESWISEEGLSTLPECAGVLREYNRAAYSPERWARMPEADAEGLISNLPVDAGNSGLAAGWAEPGFDVADWPLMTLPTKWQNAGHDYCAVFWFRKTIPLPASWRDRDLTLRLGAVDKMDITYVNGTEVGRSGSGHDASFWNVPRLYPVPATVVSGETLTVAVRVVSFSGEGGLTGPSRAMQIHPSDAPEEAWSLDGDWHYVVEQNYGQVDAAHVPGHLNQNSFHMLYDNMIAPLVPYALRWFLWYQGESNAGKAAQYAALQTALIEDWRWAWCLGRMPFLIVQLPNFGNPEGFSAFSKWAAMREAQTLAAEAVHGGLAVTLDVGDPKDIHPGNKRPVGERLAAIALADTYGFEVTKSGPIFESVARDGDSVRCRFTSTAGGLGSLGGARLENFHLATGEGDFHPVTATVDGDSVILTGGAVEGAREVAYAWSDCPLPGLLINSEGFPAAPFRRLIPAIDSGD